MKPEVEHSVDGVLYIHSNVLQTLQELHQLGFQFLCLYGGDCGVISFLNTPRELAYRVDVTRETEFPNVAEIDYPRESIPQSA